MKRKATTNLNTRTSKRARRPPTPVPRLPREIVMMILNRARQARQNNIRRIARQLRANNQWITPANIRMHLYGGFNPATQNVYPYTRAEINNVVARMVANDEL